MNTLLIATRILAATALVALAAPAFAGQPVVPTPLEVPVLPNIAYEVDYATSTGGPNTAGTVDVARTSRVDTIVSIGLPSRATVKTCPIQVVWFEFDGSVAGISGAPTAINLGETMEFTTSGNLAVPTEYFPVQENIFRNKFIPFEGYAQIRTDASCASVKLRVDAEYMTLTLNKATGDYSVAAKPVTVTGRTGLTGY